MVVHSDLARDHSLFALLSGRGGIEADMRRRLLRLPVLLNGLQIVDSLRGIIPH